MPEQQQLPWEMKGKIYTFDMASKLVAFTNDIQSQSVLIYIGGLGDTLLSTPFTSQLSQFCTSTKVRLIIPQFRTMPNYRIFPISSDVEYLHKIVLQNQGNKIILLGHSTGCQVSMLYLKIHGSKDISKVILQAPVSDVQYEESVNPQLKDHLEMAKAQKYFESPSDNEIWLSQRFLSLNERLNIEDWFSSYLPNQHYSKWKQFGIPILSIVSGADKYIVNSCVDKLKLGSQVFVIEVASHQMHEENSRKQFFQILNDKISQ